MKKLLFFLPMALLLVQPATAPAVVVVRSETAATIRQQRTRPFPHANKRSGERPVNLVAGIGLTLEILSLLVWMFSGPAALITFLAGGFLSLAGLVLGVIFGWRGIGYAIAGTLICALFWIVVNAIF